MLHIATGQYLAVSRREAGSLELHLTTFYQESNTLWLFHSLDGVKDKEAQAIVAAEAAQ